MTIFAGCRSAQTPLTARTVINHKQEPEIQSRFPDIINSYSRYSARAIFPASVTMMPVMTGSIL